MLSKYLVITYLLIYVKKKAYFFRSTLMYLRVADWDDLERVTTDVAETDNL